MEQARPRTRSRDRLLPSPVPAASAAAWAEMPCSLQPPDWGRAVGRGHQAMAPAASSRGTAFSFLSSAGRGGRGHRMPARRTMIQVAAPAAAQFSLRVRGRSRSTALINANGGSAGGACAGAGSGGAIRLVATAIAGGGTIGTSGAGAPCGGGNGSNGRVRLEAFSNAFGGNLGGNQGFSVPNQLLLPTAGAATARVISVGGMPITANPDTFPDARINTTAPVEVVIETRNIPRNSDAAAHYSGRVGRRGCRSDSTSAVELCSERLHDCCAGPVSARRFPRAEQDHVDAVNWWSRAEGCLLHGRAWITPTRELEGLPP